MAPRARAFARVNSMDQSTDQGCMGNCGNMFCIVSIMMLHPSKKAWIRRSILEKRVEPCRSLLTLGSKIMVPGFKTSWIIKVWEDRLIRRWTQKLYIKLLRSRASAVVFALRMRRKVGTHLSRHANALVRWNSSTWIACENGLTARSNFKRTKASRHTTGRTSTVSCVKLGSNLWSAVPLIQTWQYSCWT